MVVLKNIPNQNLSPKSCAKFLGSSGSNALKYMNGMSQIGEVKMTPGHALKGNWTPVYYFLRKNMFLMKKAWKKQDLNQQSSNLKPSALPNELSSLVTEDCNISLYLLITNSNLSIQKVFFYMNYLEIMKYAFIQNRLI